MLHVHCVWEKKCYSYFQNLLFNSVRKALDFGKKTGPSRIPIYVHSSK